LTKVRVMERVNDKHSTPIPDSVLSEAMNKLYNGWFRKWRGRIEGLSDPEFDAMMTEATAMIDQYAQYPLVRNLVISFVYELDSRLHSGYTKQSAEKLARIILEANA